MEALRVEAQSSESEAEKQQLAESLRQAEEARLAAEREQEKLREELAALRRRSEEAVMS